MYMHATRPPLPTLTDLITLISGEEHILCISTADVQFSTPSYVLPLTITVKRSPSGEAQFS